MATARRAIDSKLISSLLLAKHGCGVMRPGGSMALISGIAAYRPMPGGSMVAAVNGALESLVYALAIELAPLRVNAVSLGWVDTPVWDIVAGDNKHPVQAQMAERLPVGHIGKPAHIARAVLALLTNEFITGTVQQSTVIIDWFDAGICPVTTPMRRLQLCADDQSRTPPAP